MNYWHKTCPIARFSTINSTFKCPGYNLGLDDEKLASNRRFLRPPVGFMFRIKLRYMYRSISYFRENTGSFRLEGQSMTAWWARCSVWFYTWRHISNGLWCYLCAVAYRQLLCLGSKAALPNPASVGMNTIDVFRRTKKQNKINFCFSQTNSVWYCMVLLIYLLVGYVFGVTDLKAAGWRKPDIWLWFPEGA